MTPDLILRVMSLQVHRKEVGGLSVDPRKGSSQRNQREGVTDSLESGTPLLSLSVSPFCSPWFGIISWEY